MSTIALRVKNVSKSFPINSAAGRSFKHAFLHIFNHHQQYLSVLQNVSFQIKTGEFVGIIGHNGCGKSTLLKIIAGIIPVDHGQLRIDGRVSPFLELGVGFQEELSALDNIYLYGALLGMSKAQIDHQLDGIISFSELSLFLHTPLKHFSSGMFIRLAFSVAIHANFDILLLDEVLAVGDYAFQQKCFQKFIEFKQAGKTIVFVSHDLHSVARFCDRCIWLDKGRVQKIGPSHMVIDSYLTSVERDSAPIASTTVKSNSPVVLKSISLQPFHRSSPLRPGDLLKLVVELSFRQPFTNPIVGINIYDRGQNCIFALNSDYQHLRFGRLAAGCHCFAFDIQQYFVHGQYTISLALCDHTKTKILFQQDRVLTFDVVNHQYLSDGLADYPSTITHY